MNEYYLGNERVISKLVAENEPLVERVLGKIEQMKKALADKGDKLSISEKRRIDKALKLYEKAAEAAGKADLVKRIIALREEENDTIEPLADKNGSYDNENGVSDNVRTTNGNNMSSENLDSETKIRYNLRSRNYSDNEYQDYGWARENGVLSASENSKLRSLFAEAVSGQAKPPKTKSGEYMIAVGDKVDNKIAYMTGSIDSPVITRVLEIDLDNETDLDFERRKIYDAERRGIQPKAGKLFKFYHSTDYGYRQQWQGSSFENNRNNSKLGIVGGRGSKTASRIKEILFDDDGNVVSETRYSYKAPAESKVYKQIAEWEKLKVYEKAAEAAGKADLVKRIIALREEEESENSEFGIRNSKLGADGRNMSSENLDSEAEKRYNYSRKVPPRDEFATLAMQWAYSDKADIGEQKLFYRKGKWVLLEKSDDGFVEICQYTAKQYDFISKEISRHNEELHDRGINERIYRSTLRYENLGSDNPRNNRNDVGQQAGDGRVGGVYQGESDSNRSTDHEAGEHDIGNQIKYSRKTDQDRSMLTKGEAQKQKANYESDKVYTKAEISKMVESLSGLSSIPKRFRTEMVNDIWTAFNSRYSPEQREQHANFLADKIFARMMQESGDAFDNTSQEDIYAMEREIHSALKKIAREGGSPSARSKLEAEFNTSEAGYWKKQRDIALEKIKITGRLMDSASKMRSLKVGDFLKASNFKSDDLKGTVEQLARINFRGNLNVSGTRGLVKKLAEWYTKDNPMLKVQENGKLRSLFAEAVSGQAKPPKTEAGEYMIAVGDKVDNKIAYMTGSIDSPVITRILEIDEQNETQLDELRRETYAIERRGVQRKTGGPFNTYTSASFGSSIFEQRSSVQSERHNNKLGIVGGRGSKTASRIKEILFDDDGNVVSETRYSYKAPAESKVYKRIAEWEKLKVYEKAAEAAGKADLVKRILALREEEDNSAENEHLSTLSAKNQQKESLTNINQENMHVSEGEVKFSLKGTNKDGIEVYETSEAVLNLPWKERKKLYLFYIEKNYIGRTAKFIRNGHVYYAEFDRKNASKAVYGDRRSDNTGRDALINTGADGSVFELVENAKYSGSGKDTKNHTSTDYFDYFIKTVQIDNSVFDLLADVKRQYYKDDGFVYTIRLVENKKIKASPIRRGQALLNHSDNALIENTSFNESVSDNSITDSKEKVNSDTKFSYKVPAESKVYKQIAEWEKLKVYEKADAEKMLYTILSDVMTFSEDQAAVMTLEGRKNAEQLLWAELNKALTEKEMQQGAEKVADFLISRSVVKSWMNDPLEIEKINNAETVLSYLKPYLHGLNLTHIKGEIKHKYAKTAVTRQPFFYYIHFK